LPDFADHLSVGCGKRVVSDFGPTSAFGSYEQRRGSSITPSLTPSSLSQAAMAGGRGGVELGF